MPSYALHCLDTLAANYYKCSEGIIHVGRSRTARVKHRRHKPFSVFVNVSHCVPHKLWTPLTDTFTMHCANVWQRQCCSQIYCQLKIILSWWFRQQHCFKCVSVNMPLNQTYSWMQVITLLGNSLGSNLFSIRVWYELTLQQKQSWMLQEYELCSFCENAFSQTLLSDSPDAFKRHLPHLISSWHHPGCSQSPTPASDYFPCWLHVL